LDFDEDVFAELERITALRHLEPARRLAAAQLEFLKPATMTVTQKGPWCGPVAETARGAIIVVLANLKQVVTYHMAPLSDQHLINIINDAAGPIERLSDSQGEKISALNAAINKFGGKPGKHSPTIPPNLAAIQIGVVFSLMPTARRVSFANWANLCRNSDVCPSLVVLIGPGSSKQPDHISIEMATLPLATYAEAIC
jgi:hypothetical protein